MSVISEDPPKEAEASIDVEMKIPSEIGDDMANTDVGTANPERSELETIDNGPLFPSITPATYSAELEAQDAPEGSGNVLSRPPKTPPIPPKMLPRTRGPGKKGNAKISIIPSAGLLEGTLNGVVQDDEGTMSRSNSAQGGKAGDAAAADLTDTSFQIGPSLYFKAPASSWNRTESSMFVARKQAEAEDPELGSEDEDEDDLENEDAKTAGEGEVLEAAQMGNDEWPGAISNGETSKREEGSASEREDRTVNRPKLISSTLANSQPVRSRTSYAPMATVESRRETLKRIWEEDKQAKSSEGNTSISNNAASTDDRGAEGVEQPASSALNQAEIVPENLDKPPRQTKKRRMTAQERAEHIIVIHPGSRFLRIGRCTDVTPLHVRNCLYRKRSAGMTKSEKPDRYKEVGRLDELIELMRQELRQRMKVAKLKLPPGGINASQNLINRYNASQKPIRHPPQTDPYSVDWETDYSKDILFPDPNIWLPEDAPYELRYPIRHRDWNTEDYDVLHPEAVLADQEEILRHALGQLNPPIPMSDIWQYSVVLALPDHTNKPYLASWGRLLLQQMGFRQIAFLSEGVCATFGAGLSSACVIDIGATRTTVACVDDGLILPETRMVMDYGGDDITSFFTVLLTRLSFPYEGELDLNRRLHWDLMDYLKCTSVTQLDTLVAYNIWKFFIRSPSAGTLEFQYQTYDQPLLAPSSLFDTRAFNWDLKPAADQQPRMFKNDPDQMAELRDDGVTAAMELSVSHLRPAAVVSSGVVEDTAAPKAADPADSGALAGEEPAKESNDEGATAAGAVDLDVFDEARKCPLEVAVACSLVAARDKGPSLASGILLLGGTAMIEGLSAALQWRVLSQCQSRSMLSMNPEILPVPRGLLETAVVFRGASVYARLESISEFWIKRQEFDDLGLRAYRNRMS